MKKLILILMVFTLLITGCSSTDSSSNKEDSINSKEDSSSNTEGSKKSTNNNEMGLYTEECLTLPENFSSEATLQLSKIRGMPCLYVYTPEGNVKITRYLMKEDGTWTEDTPEWLRTLKLSTDYLNQSRVFEDSKGNQYLYCFEEEGDVLKGTLLRSSDGSTYETLSPEGWNEKDEEYGYYYYPQLVNVLEDGTLTALFYDGEIAFYNKDTLKKVNSITGSNHSKTILTSSGQSVIAGQTDTDNHTLLGINVYDSVNANKKESYPFKTILDGFNYLDTNEKNDLLLCNADGIHILENGTSLWQTIVDGTLTSLSMATLWCNGFIAGSDYNYYVLYNSDQGYKLMKYYFDITVDTVPSTELTIYTLKENPTLQQAASVFQQSHPGVKVSIQVAMSRKEYETATEAIKADYFKALNTELLAGKGSDMLILDDLPTDSLIEKGILSDLSDVVQPMLDKDELYENIVRQYFKDQNIYSIPARFTLPVLVANGIDASSIADIESLASYVKEHPDKNLFGMRSVEDFINVYSPFLSSRILDTNGNINRENLIETLNNLKNISAGYELVEEYGEDFRRAYGIWELASKVKLATSTCSGFFHSMFALGFVTYVNGSFTSFDQSAIPSCEIGINRNSDKQELCKEFVALLLSKEIGENDFYDGFPINKDAMVSCAAFDRSKYTNEGEIENADGSRTLYVFGELSEEQIQRLVQACSDTTYLIRNDQQILTALNEAAKDLLMGNKSVEEAADYIIENTKIYLSE